MSYPGRENIYRATIRRMTLQALEAQEQQFRQAHEGDPDEALLTLLRQWAARHHHTPWPGELTGGSYLLERFGSWERAVGLAALAPPTGPNSLQNFPRYLAETERQKELYRLKKSEKKQLACKRLSEQAEKHRSREKR